MKQIIRYRYNNVLFNLFKIRYLEVTSLYKPDTTLQTQGLITEHYKKNYTEFFKMLQLLF